MPHWLVTALFLLHLLITFLACLVAILFYFLLCKKQKQFFAARKQIKALAEEYDKLKTSLKRVPTDVAKEDWVQRQKLKSLQEEVVKLQEKILYLRKEREDLELRCKEIQDSRDLLSKELDAMRNNSSNFSNLVPERRENSGALGDFTKSASIPAGSIQGSHFSDSKNFVVSTKGGENVSEDSEDSECEYDFILTENNTTKSKVSERKV